MQAGGWEGKPVPAYKMNAKHRLTGSSNDFKVSESSALQKYDISYRKTKNLARVKICR